MANNWSATWSPKAAHRRTLQQMKDIEAKVLNERGLVKWAGPKVKSAVATRTARGVDNEDRKFTGYSDQYAERRKGGRHSPVTLFDSGQMLGLLEFKSTGTRSGKVYIKTGGSPNRAAVGAAHYHGAGNVPERAWLGMSPSDMKALERETLIYLEHQMGLELAGIGGFTKKGKAFAKKGSKVWVYSHPR